jgi:hypothetical protein
MKKIFYTAAFLIICAKLFAQIPDPCVGANASLAKSIASPCNCEESQSGSSCNKTVYINQAASDADIQSFFNTQFGYGQPNIPVAWQDIRSSNMMVDVASPGIKHEFSTEFTTGPTTTSVAVINIFQVRSGCAGACQNYIITKKTDPCGTNLITPTLIPSTTTPVFNYRAYTVAPNTTYIITRQVVYDGTSAPCFSSWTGADGSPSGGAQATAQHWFIWSSGGALPINGLQLSTKQLNASVMLQWHTAQEINTAKFEIEKSSDAINYTKIGELAATGNSYTQKNYWFEDKVPEPINYYRIKAIDNDAKATYSPISKLSFKMSDMASIIIAPNPVKQYADIIIESKQVVTTPFKIINTNGQTVQSGKITLQKGINKINKNVTTLTSGYYLFVAEVNGERITAKLVKE